MKQVLLGVSAVVVLASAAVRADTAPRWKVVLASSAPAVQIPNLPPSSTYAVISGQLGDAGPAQLTFDLYGQGSESDMGLSGLWHDAGANAAPFASRNATGATGPGLSGEEAAHVFRALDWMMDTSGDGHIVFGGFTGDPAQPVESATEGVWIFDGQRNTEIARVGTDGALGPQLGAGWVFDGFDGGDSGEVIATAMNGGAAFLRARTHGPSSGNVAMISRYTPTLGLSPCALEGSSGPALSPGVGAGPFTDIQYPFYATANGLYARASVGNAGARRNGVWQFCNGAPRAAALAGATGALGPGIVSSVDARFTDVSYAIASVSPDTFYFSATAVRAPGGAEFNGVYLHTPSGNQPVVIDDGSVSTGMPGHSFAFDWQVSLFSSANQVVMLGRTSDDVGGGYRQGLWRLVPGQPPRPLALTGPDSPYPPAAGHHWDGFGWIAVFANGEIAMLASTDLGLAVWRLHDDQAPVRVLSIGDAISVPTSAGTVTAPLTGFPIQLRRSTLSTTTVRDRMYGENGDVLVLVQIAGYSDSIDNLTWVRGNVLSDALFANGFD